MKKPIVVYSNIPPIIGVVKPTHAAELGIIQARAERFQRETSRQSLPCNSFPTGVIIIFVSQGNVRQSVQDRWVFNPILRAPIGS